MHSAAEVRAHINKAAARLGLPGLDDDGDDDTEDATTDREAERRPASPGRARAPPRTGTPPGREGGPQGPVPGREGGAVPRAAQAQAGQLARHDCPAHGRAGRQHYQTIALSAEQAGELGLAGDALSPADRNARRNPEYFVSRPATRRGLFDGPGAGARSASRLRHPRDPDEDPTDTQAEKEIARLLKEHGGTGLFGGGAAYGANQTHRR